jgi:hypothetical protein
MTRPAARALVAGPGPVQMVRAPVMNPSTRERVCPVIQAALRTAKEGDRSNVLGFRGASATVVPEAMWHLPLVLPVLGRDGGRRDGVHRI